MKRPTPQAPGSVLARAPRQRRAKPALTGAAQLHGAHAAQSMRAAIDAWFAARGWRPADFQREVWTACANGESGLLHASTGAGKTHAVWFGALLSVDATALGKALPLSVLWITPMRALAQDTGRTLQASVDELGVPWSVGVRSGDSTAAERARQAKRLPSALVTTPESLSLLLARADAGEQLGRVRMVVVDEWHELLGNKRGVQTQLAIARLRRWNPALQVWGLSATLGDIDHALAALVGPGRAARTVRGETTKAIIADTLIPDDVERFPWAGHMSTRLLPQVIREIEGSGSTLLFTNTRSQAETWYQALLDARPDWAGEIALHHGSLDRELRDFVERGLKRGSLRAVVCTSSLDLGVDFLPVERVLQLGSPKGVARLLQRAGRSGHAPGRVSRVTCTPTHSFELLEAAAARVAIGERRVESRSAPRAPLDVLVQHMVTVALGGGFEPDDLLAEVRTTWSFRDLDAASWRWALDFVSRGGQALNAYPEYRKVAVEDDGRYRVPDATVAKRHRMSVGTIVGDAAMDVRWVSGGRIGSVEESFISRLNRGDCFLFAGRALELVRVNEMTAYVRRASGRKASVPRWMGGKMPLSSELAASVRSLIGKAREGTLAQPELQALAPLFDLQRRWSAIPAPDEVLIETMRSREGHHLFCFPFAGRLVHSGLSALLAWRIARRQPGTFSLAVNDYGFELLTAAPIDWARVIDHALFDTAELEHDIEHSMNAAELARRRFREIARVAGLVFQGYPGQHKSMRQLQASSGLLFDVFSKYDPGNLLLAQARAESLQQELELSRLTATLESISAQKLLLTTPAHFTPFAFPLMVDRIRERLSTESLADRVARMVQALEKAARA